MTEARRADLIRSGRCGQNSTDITSWSGTCDCDWDRGDRVAPVSQISDLLVPAQAQARGSPHSDSGTNHECRPGSVVSPSRCSFSFSCSRPCSACGVCPDTGISPHHAPRSGRDSWPQSPAISCTPTPAFRVLGFLHLLHLLRLLHPPLASISCNLLCLLRRQIQRFLQYAVPVPGALPFVPQFHTDTGSTHCRNPQAGGRRHAAPIS